MLKIIIEKIWLTVFAHPNLARFNYYLINLFQKAVGINNYKSSFDSGEEHFMKTVVKKCSIKTVFDIGAHTGDFVNMAVESGITGTIYAFEPHPKTYEILKKNTERLSLAKHYNLGFSDHISSELLFDYGETTMKHGSPHATLYSDVITDMHKSANSKSTRVQLTTVDSFCIENEIFDISLLKIDTEGNEYKILQGAKNMIENDKIGIILFEFGEMNVASHVYFKDFYDFLSDKYQIYRLLPKGFIQIQEYNSRTCEIFIYQNYVAFHKKIHGEAIRSV